MKSATLLAACVALACGISAEAVAKGGRGLRSHSSSHGHETHAGEGGVTGAVARSVLPRGRNPDGADAGAAPAAVEESPGLSQQREAARAKEYAEIMAARKVENAAAEEKRRQRAEQAAIAAAQEQQRRDAETRARDREQTAQDRKQALLAWENRCQIKAVMTDMEIATCREAWTTPVR